MIYPGARIKPAHDRSRAVLRRMSATFEQTFPQLSGVRFTHHWGGPVGITASFLPIFGTLPDDSRLHYGLAYNGHGVAPTHTGGKILRDKVLGRTSEYTELCFVDAREAPLAEVAGAGPASGLTFTLAASTRASGNLVASFTLAGGASAVLELHDIAGRRLLRRDVAVLGPGPHDLELDPSTATRSGVYFATLREGRTLRHARAVLLR